MTSRSAIRAASLREWDTVLGPAALAEVGWSWDDAESQCRAGRWQRVGRAVVRHNAELSERDRQLAALINCGPRSALTAFTALQRWGLSG